MAKIYDVKRVVVELQREDFDEIPEKDKKHYDEFEKYGSSKSRLYHAAKIALEKQGLQCVQAIVYEMNFIADVRRIEE